MIQIGTKAEIELSLLLAEPLLADFVFLNPVYDEGTKTRELCDLLVEDGSSGIPIQLKFQDREKANTDRNEVNWAKKKLKSASIQLTGAMRNIERYSIRTTHKYRGTLCFPANYFTCKFGIVIVDYKSEPFVLDPALPRRNKYNIPIHYFTYNDIITLCQKLMSLPDLVDYLEQRSLIPAWATPKFGDEKNAYAYYLTNKGKFAPTVSHSDFEKKWDELTTRYSEKYNEKEYEDENVQIYNEILKTFATKEPVIASEQFEFIKKITDLKDPNRVDVTRILNKVRRIHRREIAKKLLEKIMKAESSELGFNYFAHKTENSDDIFVFLASRNDRKKRIEELLVIMDCVNNVYHHKRVIGIATESKQAPDGRSFDVMYFEDRPASDNETDIKLCKQFIGELKIEREYDFPSEKGNKR